MADGVEVLLLGNPNAGKSTLFNALTGGHARVGNWHGVTVGVLSGKAKGLDNVTVYDLPGIYSADGLSMEEGFTRKFVESHPRAFILFVSECGSLSRSVPLFCALAKGRRAALVLTKRRSFERSGGKADIAAISARLKIPVIDADIGKKRLRGEISSAIGAATVFYGGDVGSAVTPPPAGLSRVDKLLLNGWVGIPVFFAILCLAFFLTFAPNLLGDRMKTGVEDFFGVYLAGKAGAISSPVLRSFVADGILKSLGGVLCFLPQIALLYLILIVLEESGLFSRLAILSDGFFSKFGLSGRAAFSLLLGFGCTAAAILTTRSLDDKNIQRRVIACLPYISCSAKLPVYLTLSASFFSNPFVAVLLLYVLGVGISLAVTLCLKESPPPFVLELAPLQLPRPLFVLKSLLFQLRQFIIKVATVVLAFLLFSWMLSSFDFTFTLCAVENSMLAKLCSGLSFLFAPAGMGDWRIAYAALSGLIAKENIAGTLSMFYGEFPFSPQSAFALSVFVLTCSPCVSAIAASARELGWKRALLDSVLQTASALLLCYLTYFALTGGVAYVALCIVLLAALLIIGKTKRKSRKTTEKPQKTKGNLGEKLSRYRGNLFKKLHR